MMIATFIVYFQSHTPVGQRCLPGNGNQDQEVYQSLEYIRQTFWNFSIYDKFENIWKIKFPG